MKASTTVKFSAEEGPFSATCEVRDGVAGVIIIHGPSERVSELTRAYMSSTGLLNADGVEGTVLVKNQAEARQLIAAVQAVADKVYAAPVATYTAGVYR